MYMLELIVNRLTRVLFRLTRVLLRITGARSVQARPYGTLLVCSLQISNTPILTS